MKGSDYFWQRGRLLVLAVVAILVVTGWSQSKDWASAQEAGISTSKLMVTAEPISPVSTPVATDDHSPPDESAEGETPSAPIHVITTVEPVTTPRPPDGSNPTATPDEIGVVIDPPDQAELGEPVRDQDTVTLDDRIDDGNHAIDIFDLTFVAARYGTDDPAADLNLDGAVDIFDLAIVASNFNRSEPIAGAVVVTPPPVPEVEASGADFGLFDLPPGFLGGEVSGSQNAQPTSITNLGYQLGFSNPVHAS